MLEIAGKSSDSRLVRFVSRRSKGKEKSSDEHDNWVFANLHTRWARKLLLNVCATSLGEDFFFSLEFKRRRYAMKFIRFSSTTGLNDDSRACVTARFALR